MTDVIENPALARIENPQLTTHPQGTASMPSSGAGHPMGGDAGIPSSLHAQRQLENPPLSPATGAARLGGAAPVMGDLGGGRRLVPGVIPQIENPELD